LRTALPSRLEVTAPLRGLPAANLYRGISLR
jgi:hypothetical protein